MKGVEHEGERLVDCVFGAVRETDLGFIEPARPETDEVPDRPQALALERPIRHGSAGSDSCRREAPAADRFRRDPGASGHYTDCVNPTGTHVLPAFVARPAAQP